jgi:hypothetical protein
MYFGLTMHIIIGNFRCGLLIFPFSWHLKLKKYNRIEGTALMIGPISFTVNRPMFNDK